MNAQQIVLLLIGSAVSEKVTCRGGPAEGRLVRLSQFIKSNTDRLVEEWEAFARTAQPLPAVLTDEELRDWAQQTIEAVAADMEVPETEEEELRRSRGLETHEGLVKVGNEHAAERLMHGFTLEQLACEFRALRASVIRSWLREATEGDGDAPAQLFRFDQALDECFAASMTEYTKRLERLRHLVLGTLGHDLRSPLSAISSGVEYLSRTGGNLTNEQTRNVVRLRNSVDRMKRMIADILDFTRTRLGGTLPISLDRMDLADALRLVVDEMRGYHPARELILRVSGDLTGSWDRARIEQIASNLISNALKYSAPDTPVTVLAADRGDEVVFSVHNEGEPIPGEAQRLTFDPLVRGGPEARERRSKDGGVGLGLYIAKQIAEAHGGRIELGSRQGAGTVFKVSLPRYPMPRPQ